MALPSSYQFLQKKFLFMNSVLRKYTTRSTDISSKYASLLQEPTKKKSLTQGKILHSQIIQQGIEMATQLSTKLLIMYSKCGNYNNARQVFDKMSEPGKVAWTTIIADSCKNGKYQDATNQFSCMINNGVLPDQFVFNSLLSSCKNRDEFCAKMLHCDIIKRGLHTDFILSTRLIEIYKKNDNLESLCNMFDEMPTKDASSWIAVLAVSARLGKENEALEMYQEMKREGISVDEYGYSSLIHGCSKIRDLDSGREIHKNVIVCGFESSWSIRNTIVEMYAKCMCLGDARLVFEGLCERELWAWNAMLECLCCNGDLREAASLFREMPERSVVSWTNMIVGLAKNGCEKDGISLFLEMVYLGLRPDQFLCSCVLLACSGLKDRRLGELVHCLIIRHGFGNNASLGNSLIEMYCKCGEVEISRKLFDKTKNKELVSWSSMLVGYAQNGDKEKCLEMFYAMPQKNAENLNPVIASLLQNGNIDAALEVFQNMGTYEVNYMKVEVGSDLLQRDVSSWNAMISGLVQNEEFEKAFEFFKEMKSSEIKPNSITYHTMVSACAQMAGLKHGEAVHQEIITSGFSSNVALGNSLVSMYAKCGSIENAAILFDMMTEKNVVSWSTMICSYGMHGSANQALNLFKEMQKKGFMPNGVTFLGILCACGHSGLVDSGWHFFNLMKEQYHIEPSIRHYCCMVDLLGRAGLLKEAEQFVLEMPIEPNPIIWRSLLGACMVHYDIKLGERVADRLFQLDPDNSTHYVLLSNMYALAERWDDIQRIRNLMRDRGVRKPPGCSWIDIKGECYAFTGDGLEKFVIT